jgi:hypothetical protein
VSFVLSIVLNISSKIKQKVELLDFVVCVRCVGNIIDLFLLNLYDLTDLSNFRLTQQMAEFLMADCCQQLQESRIWLIFIQWFDLPKNSSVIIQVIFFTQLNCRIIFIFLNVTEIGFVKERWNTQQVLSQPCLFVSCWMFMFV